MKAAAMIFLLAAAATPTASAAERFPALFTGIVSDSECGLAHEVMKKKHRLPDDRTCTLVCCDRYRQEFVLADHVSGEIYQLDDQKAVRRFANHLVRVLGTLESGSGTIHVVTIEPVR